MASALATISRARSNTASPASVSSTPRAVRRSSSKPSSASSLPTAVDTADCVRWSSSAARVNVPACVTCTNARNCRSSITPSYVEGQTLNKAVDRCHRASELPVGGVAPTVGGVTATTVNRWAGTFAAKAPPESFFAISAVFHYLGPAFAVLLFARVEVLGVAWLRIASAALIFAVWRKPWRAFAALDRDGRRVLVAWGAVLAVMNCVFYSAIDRLPLGTVAAIEFLPVIVLAAIGMRTARNLAALAMAVAGVYLLTDVVLEGEPLGVALAAVNAVLFALYIVLGAKVAEQGAGAGIDALAAAMLIAAVVVTPIGGPYVVGVLDDPVAIAAGIGVGVSSSVIPYVADQLALARISRATYALMVSLLPATATVIGIVVLGQLPTWVEVAGVALVVAGVAVHRER